MTEFIAPLSYCWISDYVTGVKCRLKLNTQDYTSRPCLLIVQRCRQNVCKYLKDLWRLVTFSKLSINTDKVKHLWVDLRDMDTVNTQNLNEVPTKCLFCTRLAGRCRGRLCIWWDWGSLPLCWQTTGSSGRSSCPGERSWCLQKCPAGRTIASGEFADTEIHTKTRLKWQNSNTINRIEIKI